MGAVRSRYKDGLLKKRENTGLPGKRAAAEDLPRAELDVLGCLWRQGEATARQIRDQLADYRPMAHGSVLTLLGRLSAKGLVSREKAARGKAFVYRATRHPDAIHRRILKNLTERVFGGDRMAMIASLLDTHSPSEEELAAMERLLRELRRERGGNDEN